MIGSKGLFRLAVLSFLLLASKASAYCIGLSAVNTGYVPIELLVSGHVYVNQRDCYISGNIWLNPGGGNLVGWAANGWGLPVGFTDSGGTARFELTINVMTQSGVPIFATSRTKCFVFSGLDENSPNQVFLLQVQGDEIDMRHPKKWQVGDPFNPMSGAVVCNAKDISIPLPGIPLAVSREYNSASPGSTEFGSGWSFAEESTLHVEQSVPFGSGYLSYTWIDTGDGRHIALHKETQTNWVSNADARLRLFAAAGGQYEMQELDGRTRTRFDSSGRWLWTGDYWSNSVTALRNTSGSITSLVHSCGRALNFSWSGSRVSCVNDSEGSLSVEYYYSSDGLLTSVVRRAASGVTSTEVYTYNPASGLLLSSCAPDGQTITFGYDASRRCITNVFADGTFGNFAAWAADGLSSTITSPVDSTTNRLVTYTWMDPSTNSLGSQLLYSSGSGAFVPGDSFLVNFNLAATNPAEPSRLYVAQSLFCMKSVSMGSETTSYFYGDDYWWGAPLATMWTANSQTAMVTTVVDSLHRPIEYRNVYGACAPTVIRTDWLDSWDLASRVTDENGWRTDYGWTNGLLCSVAHTNCLIGTSMVYSQGLLVGISDPLKRATALSYDRWGRLEMMTPPAGPAVSFTNDVFGNPTAMVLPAQVSGYRCWRFLRDGFGRVTNAVDPDGIGMLYGLDQKGRVTNVVDRAGRSAAIVYGTAGNPLSFTRMVQENGSNRSVTINIDRDWQMDPKAIRDFSGRSVESYVRNDAGRVVTITNVEGRTATTSYGVLGLPGYIDRFDGSHVTFAYGTGARLASAGFPGHTNTYCWLGNGLQSAIADGATTVTNTWVEPGWLAVQEIQAGTWAGRVEHSYDLAGNATQTVAKCNGATIAVREMAYDSGDRETNLVFTAGGASLSMTREYGDWNGLPVRLAATDGTIEECLAWDVLDRLTNIVWRCGTNEIRSISYRLDVLGQITQRVDRVAGVETVHSYAYDGLDRLASETNSSGFGATYSYTDTGIRLAKSSARFDVSYTAGGGDRLARWDVTRTNLASAFLVTGHSTELPSTNAEYRFLAASNAVTSVVPTMDGTSFTVSLPYEAGNTQRVIVALSDPAGNVGRATGTFVRAVFTSGEYSSDAAGCVTQVVYSGAGSQKSVTLSWDSEYRLRSVETNGVTAESFNYAPDGRRITTTPTDGTVTWHVWDGQHVIADTDATGKVLRAYAYGPNTDELLSIIVLTNDTPRTYYTIRDHQNTVWALADTNGVAVENYDYDAWGRLLSVKDVNGTPLIQSAFVNRCLFQGRDYSWATGLHYFRARWYEPVTGRWLSPDPIGISGGLNQYVAFDNNPVNLLDPDGLATYRQNRELGGRAVRSNYNPVSHTFVFTTNPDGSLNHTYSWGNKADTHRWHIDQPEDIAAAQGALKNPKGLKKKGCDEVDPYVDQVFQDWINDPSHIHRNCGVARNCKGEADQLIEEAIRRMNEVNASRAALAEIIVNSAFSSLGLPY